MSVVVQPKYQEIVGFGDPSVTLQWNVMLLPSTSVCLTGSPWYLLILGRAVEVANVNVVNYFY